MLLKDTETYQKALGYVQLLKLDGKPDEEAIAELKLMYKLTEAEAQDILNTFKTEKKDIYTAQIWSNIKLALGPLAYCAVVAVIYFAMGSSFNGGLKTFNTAYALLFVFAGISVVAVIFRLLNERIETTSFMKFIKASKAYQLYRGYATNKTTWTLLALACFAFVYLHLLSNNVSDVTKWTQVNNLVLTEDCKEIVITGKSNTYYYLFTTAQTSKPFKWFRNDHYYQFAKGVSSPDKYFRAGDTVSIWVNKKELIYDPSSFFDRCNEVYNIAKKGESPVLDIVGRDRAASQQNKKVTLVLITGFILTMILSRLKKKKPATSEL